MAKATRKKSIAKRARKASPSPAVRRKAPAREAALQAHHVRQVTSDRVLVDRI
jgi:hypothetical protein